MKYGVIDIGSNSVRLLIWSDGKTLYKTLNSTRLGENLAQSGRLLPEAIERSAKAVQAFCLQVKAEGADKLFVFATAAVRSAQNGEEFCKRTKELTGITVDVISGEEEASVGLLGALGGQDGGILDIGGGSTEFTLQRNHALVYAKSIDVGAVRLMDTAGRDKEKLLRVIESQIAAYEKVKIDVPVYGIGGTVTSAAAVLLGLKEYDGAKIQDFPITQKAAEDLAEQLLKLSPEEIEKSTCLPLKRAEIIAGGTLLLARLMEYFRLPYVLASEKDNLEGYLLKRLKDEQSH